MTDILWQRALRCISCGGQPAAEGAGLHCAQCGRTYRKEGDSIVLRDEAPDQLRTAASAAGRRDAVTLRLKAWVKRSPQVFAFFSTWTCAFIGVTATKAVASLPADALILNIGSGVRRVRSGVIQVDYDAFRGVDVAADVQHLPFQDASVDAIVAESLIEHLPDPAIAVAEIHRVLKPGGLLYVVTPFMLGYHSSPKDYYRWTEFGMEKLLQGFSITASGNAWGATAAMTSLLGNWLSLVLSLGIPFLYQLWSAFFLVLFGPITYLDVVISRHARARDSAHGLYFIAHRA